MTANEITKRIAEINKEGAERGHLTQDNWNEYFKLQEEYDKATGTRKHSTYNE